MTFILTTTITIQSSMVIPTETMMMIEEEVMAIIATAGVTVVTHFMALSRLAHLEVTDLDFHPTSVMDVFQYMDFFMVDMTHAK